MMSNQRAKLLESLRVDTNASNHLMMEQRKKNNGSTSGGVSENKGVSTEMLDTLNDR